MKLNYEEAENEIVMFEIADVIRASDDLGPMIPV